MSLLSDELPDELIPFKERLSPRFYEVRRGLVQYIVEDVLPARAEWRRQRKELEDKAAHPTEAPMPPMHWELQRKAKERGLFNFFLPEVGGLTGLEYAPLQEILGAVPEANLAMNCMAPDTGNMEVLERYGSAAQKQQWLEPLLAGTIRSAFAMTEPGVASSDATNICSTIRREGDEYVVDGHKWYISGAIRPECKVFIFLGKSSNTGPVHKRFSMILVPRCRPPPHSCRRRPDGAGPPAVACARQLRVGGALVAPGPPSAWLHPHRDAAGVKILRPLALFGHEHDHAEIIFNQARAQP